MGLEIVEIVMQIEDRFQINFSERHLAEVRTVDDLVYGIAAIFEEARNEAGTNASCPGFPAFFALRRSLIGLANVPHHSIRPSSRFTCLLSPWGRRDTWRRLEEATRISLPPLRRHPVIRILVSLTVIIPLLESVSDGWSLSISELLHVSATAMVIGLLGAWLTLPLRLCIPAHCQTVADAVRLARPPQFPPRNCEFFEAESTEKIRSAVREIVGHVLNRPPQSIVADARLIEDLGCS